MKTLTKQKPTDATVTPEALPPATSANSGLRYIGGSTSADFETPMIEQIARCMWLPESLPLKKRAAALSAAVAGAAAFRPTDEVEAMIAIQAVAMHHASLECSRRAMLAELPTQVEHLYRKGAVAASHAFVQLVGALDRKRGKGGQQRVVVEHVHVHSGGQAVVGAVATTGGAGKEAGGRPCEPPAPLVKNAPAGAGRAAVRRKASKRTGVSMSGHEEWQVPPARRRQHRAKNG